MTRRSADAPSSDRIDATIAAISASARTLEAFGATAIRTQSRTALDVLARGIDPSMTFSDVVTHLRATPPALVGREARRRSSPLLPADLLGAWWRTFARVAAFQHHRAQAGSDGLRAYEVAGVLTPAGLWSRQDALTYAQLQWAHGDRRTLRSDTQLLSALRTEDANFLAVDLASDAHGVGSAAWDAALAIALGDVGAVTVDLTAATPFDGLRSTTERVAADGPLVTVIMSAFRPGPETITSVRSILEQTWNELELLVVDDASGADYAEVLDQIDALDSRIRVLRQTENRGTYAARNRALRAARGEFITFQDSDDWSHPERIERQVARLQEDGALPAVMSRSIRCTETLDFQHVGYRTCRPNVSSLMIRRSTYQELGRFDEARKGADSEYEMRIAAVFGRRVPVMRETLAFVRLDPDSLSRSDFQPGWWHAARYAYRDAYQHWHRAIRAGAAPVLPAVEAPRIFPAPRAFVRGTAHAAPRDAFDTVFVADWCELGGRETALLQRLRAGAASGERVGIIHVESFRDLERRTQAISDEISQLLADGSVTRVLFDDDVHVGELIIAEPALLASAAVHAVSVAADAVTIITASSSTGHGSTSLPDKPAAITALVTHIWGVTPTWVPTGATGLFEPRTRVPAPRRERPVVGAVIAVGGDPLSADAEAILALLPNDGSTDVRVIAPRRALIDLIGSVPAEWLVYHPSETNQAELYQQIDFLVSLLGVEHAAHVLPRVLEALAFGVISVLPGDFEPLLGGVALYADPADVPGLGRRLVADPAAYSRLRDRAVASAVSQFGIASARTRPAQDFDENGAPA